MRSNVVKVVKTRDLRSRYKTPPFNDPRSRKTALGSFKAVLTVLGEKEACFNVVFGEKSRK